MQMSSWRSLRALRNVCGNDALKNVYLATTMWEKLATEAEGVEREGLLLEPKYWGDMAKKGCKIHRLQNNAKSALALVRRVIDGSRPIVLQIQRELVDEAKDFDETDAGRELKSELIREREKFQAEKEDMLRDLEEKRLWREETAKKLESLEEQVHKKNADIENLQSTFENAGKEITRERMQEKETYEMEKKALVKEIEMRRALDGEKQSWTEETEDALEELEDELKRKNIEIESMRFNLTQTAATNLRQDYDLGQAKRALTEEQEKYKGKLQRREDRMHSMKAEIEEKKEKLRAERERSAKEKKRGDEYRDKYYDMKARVDRREQTIAMLRSSNSSSSKYKH
ncbi:hypothetical protein F4678DRAFT_80149 [Xylaria arbuscula]|nr:hypothetical protein F4678DRAFT_80149 [Xylaria arbuscula]